MSRDYIKLGKFASERLFN